MSYQQEQCSRNIQNITHLHKDRPSDCQKILNAYELTFLDGQLSNLPEFACLSTLLTIMELCGDFDLQSFALQYILKQNDVFKYQEWFAEAWFRKSPAVVKAFLELLQRPIDEVDISNFLMTYNLENGLCFVYSIPSVMVRWNHQDLPRSTKGTAVLHLNCGTRTLKLNGVTPPSTFPNKIFVLSGSQIKKAQVHIHSCGAKAIQGLDIVSSEGLLTVHPEPALENRHWKKIQEFLMYIAEVSVETVHDGKSIKDAAVDDHGYVMVSAVCGSPDTAKKSDDSGFEVPHHNKCLQPSSDSHHLISPNQQVLPTAPSLMVESSNNNYLSTPVEKRNEVASPGKCDLFKEGEDVYGQLGSLDSSNSDSCFKTPNLMTEHGISNNFENPVENVPDAQLLELSAGAFSQNTFSEVQNDLKPPPKKVGRRSSRRSSVSSNGSVSQVKKSLAQDPYSSESGSGCETPGRSTRRRPGPLLPGIPNYPEEKKRTRKRKGRHQIESDPGQPSECDPSPLKDQEDSCDDSIASIDCGGVVKPHPYSMPSLETPCITPEPETSGRASDNPSVDVDVVPVSEEEDIPVDHVQSLAGREGPPPGKPVSNHSNQSLPQAKMMEMVEEVPLCNDSDWKVHMEGEESASISAGAVDISSDMSVVDSLESAHLLLKNVEEDESNEISLEETVDEEITVLNVKGSLEQGNSPILSETLQMPVI